MSRYTKATMLGTCIRGAMEALAAGTNRGWGSGRARTRVIFFSFLSAHACEVESTRSILRSVERRGSHVKETELWIFLSLPSSVLSRAVKKDLEHLRGCASGAAR
jgi:hypothetical protein